MTCKKCGKPSWAGCGAHVEQVLGHVPKEQRCRCASKGSASKRGAAKVSRSADALVGTAPAKRRWFGR